MGLLNLFSKPLRSGGEQVDITSPAHKVNPDCFYARLRVESPVHRVTLPDGQTAYLVVRYDDVVQVLKDDRFAKDRFRALSREQLGRQPWMPAIFRPLLKNMLDQDAPNHTRLRALVHKAFTPRLVEGMRHRTQTLADELLDKVSGQARIDLIRDYAQPIPTTIIAEMLGVPVRDRHKFQKWSQAIVAANSPLGMLLAIPSVWFFLRYVRRLIERKRSRPEADLLSALVQAREANDALSEDELVAMAFLLIIAGHETTVNLIGNGMLALLIHPDQLERLRAEPEWIRSAVEEVLRFASPVETATERYACEDVTIAGVTIPRGALVLAAIASANRDATHFSDPDRLDIAREPNRHLSFGLGAHYCLGAALARMEAQIALGTLVRRAAHLRLGTSFHRLRWRRGLVLRGLEALPLQVCFK